MNIASPKESRSSNSSGISRDNVSSETCNSSPVITGCDVDSFLYCFQNGGLVIAHIKQCNVFQNKICFGSPRRLRQIENDPAQLDLSESSHFKAGEFSA